MCGQKQKRSILPEYILNLLRLDTIEPKVYAQACIAHKKSMSVDLRIELCKVLLIFTDVRVIGDDRGTGSIWIFSEVVVVVEDGI